MNVAGLLAGLQAQHDEVTARAAELRGQIEHLTAALIRTAFELFAEQGYDATTVAEIAERAEDSPRTVAMYFPSKQDIAMSRFSEGADRLTEAMRERRPEERVVDVLGRWLRAERESGEGELDELERRMFVANPELAALRTARRSPCASSRRPLSPSPGTPASLNTTPKLSQSIKQA